jgi:hypothetical protein
VIENNLVYTFASLAQLLRDFKSCKTEGKVLRESEGTAVTVKTLMLQRAQSALSLKFKGTVAACARTSLLSKKHPYYPDSDSLPVSGNLRFARFEKVLRVGVSHRLISLSRLFEKPA